MASIASQLRNRKWTRDSHLISTDISLISIKDLNDAFASEEFYWGKPLPEPVAKETLQNSLCFALYDLKTTPLETAEDLLRQKASGTTVDDDLTPKFIGFARLVTDFTTFAFVTDVWVDPSTQGKGLGTWLIGRVQEVIESMPHLRRSLLFTSNWEKSVPFYEKFMKMELVECRRGGDAPAVMQMKWKGHPDYMEPNP